MSKKKFVLSVIFVILGIFMIGGTAFADDIPADWEWHQNSEGLWWYGSVKNKESYAKSQWLQIKGKWFYFDETGFMAVKQYRDGYWLDAEGYCDVDSEGHWVTESNGKKRYVDRDYTARFIWLTIDGYDYRFDKDGYLVTNEWVETSGVLYYVDKNGKYIKGAKKLEEVKLTNMSSISRINGWSSSKKVTYSTTPATYSKDDLVWSSDNKSVITVENGVITPHAVGEATVTLQSKYPGGSAKCKITVEYGDLFIINEDSKSILMQPSGNPETVRFEKNPLAKNLTIKWQSGDTNVATVSNGKVTPVGEGETDITVSARIGDTETKETIHVQVSERAYNIPEVKSFEVFLENSNTTIDLYKTSKVDLKVRVTLPNDEEEYIFTPATEDTKINGQTLNVKWESSDTNCATVEKGRVTFLKPGTVWITATSNAKYSTQQVIEFNVSYIPKWKTENGKTYYWGTEGKKLTGKQSINGKLYILAPVTGERLSGWQEYGGSYYYLNPMVVTGWKKIDGKWYHFNGSGEMETGWKRIDGKWYHFNDSGVMETGWKKIEGEWYFFKSGVMLTGWQYSGGKWRFFKGGALYTGWGKFDGDWYYFDPEDGAMTTGSRKIGTKTYNFSTDGVCLNP